MRVTVYALYASTKCVGLCFYSAADSRAHMWAQVKGLQGPSEVLPQRSAVSRVSTLRRSDSSSKLLSPRSNSKLARVLHRSQHSTPATLQRQGSFAPVEVEEVQETLQAAPSEPTAGAAEGDSPRSCLLFHMGNAPAKRAVHACQMNREE